MIKTQIVALIPNTLPARFKVATKVEMDDGEVRFENRLDNLSIQQMDTIIAEHQAVVDGWESMKASAEALLIEA